MLRIATGLRIWFDKDAGTSAWDVRFEIGSFVLLISPEIYRGFSGEGQVLEDLANPPSDEVIANVRAQLNWASQINTAHLSQTLSIDEDDIRKAISILSTRGLAGYDVSSGTYFHRELPFNLEEVEKLQPRLKNARRLIEERKLKLLQETPDGVSIYEVAGTGTSHQVRISDDHKECTCPWFSKHQDKRGLCKHILAAQILTNVDGVEHNDA